MTEREALLQAILAEPQDDAVRLIYADWLEEHGDESERARAEFIRVQVEFTRCDGERLRWLGRRQSDLLHKTMVPYRKSGRSGAMQAYYFWGPQELHSCREAKWTFGRGFVHAVRCPLASWLDHGGQIVRAHPVVKIEISDRQPQQYDHGADGRPYWRWFDGSRRGEDFPIDMGPSELPGSLWKVYDAVCREKQTPSWLCPWEHTSEQAALAALSDVLLRIARDPKLIAEPRHVVWHG